MADGELRNGAKRAAVPRGRRRSAAPVVGHQPIIRVADWTVTDAMHAHFSGSDPLVWCGRSWFARFQELVLAGLSWVNDSLSNVTSALMGHLVSESLSNVTCALMGHLVGDSLSSVTCALMEHVQDIWLAIACLT